MIDKTFAEGFLNVYFKKLLEDNCSDDSANNYFFAQGFLFALSEGGYSKEWCEKCERKLRAAYLDGDFLKYIVDKNERVFERYVNGETIKEDLPCLINAKWRSLKKRDINVPKEEGLLAILECLEHNNNVIELSQKEYNSLIAEE